MSTPIQPHQLEQPITAFVRPIESTLRDDLSVGEALDVLRRRTIGHKIFYLYVVDRSDRLVGILPTRTLLVSPADARIGSIMSTELVTIPASATLDLALEMFAMHRLMALPVVDDDGCLVGAVDIRLYADEMFDMAERQHVADVFQLIGLSVEQQREGSPWRSFRTRMPWLACNLVGGVACAVIAGVFEDVLDKVLLLAMFIPLVLTLAESISVQALSMVLGRLHGSAVPARGDGSALA